MGKRTVVLWHGGRYHPLRLRAVMEHRGSEFVYLLDRPEVLMMPEMPKLGLGGLPDLPRKPSELMEQFPKLHAWLTDTEYEPGKPVGMVMLSIRPTYSSYRTVLRIADHGGLKLEVEAETVEEGLLMLELALGSNPVPWKRDDFPLGKITGKKK